MTKNRTLTAAEVAELRLRAATDPSFSVVAEGRRLGRSTESLRRLLRGETYVHVAQEAQAERRDLTAGADALAALAKEIAAANSNKPLEDLLK